MIIRHYYVSISDHSGIIKGDNEFKVTELNVIGENSVNLVVDDIQFTTIRKSHDRYSTCLNHDRIHVNVSDSVWGSRVTYNLYTDRTKKASTIRKEIEQAIQQKVGFFTSRIDLSVIKD